MPGLLLCNVVGYAFGLYLAVGGSACLFLLFEPTRRFQCSACDSDLDEKQDRCHACNREMTGGEDVAHPPGRGLARWMAVLLIVIGLVLLFGWLTRDESDSGWRRIYPSPTNPW